MPSRTTSPNYTTMETKFASPERHSKEQVLKIASRLRAEILLPWFDAVPINILVINEYRQIVFCNQAFRTLSGRLEQEEALGLRPGEALRCVHAEVEESGCGCSEFCRLCGAAQAILSSMRGLDDCRECRMLRKVEDGLSPLDLQVFTKTIAFEGSPFVLFTAIDVSHEKRLRYMERSFFHELINVSGGIALLTDLMEEAGDDSGKNMELLAECSRRLVVEAIYHRDVTAAEIGRLGMNPGRIEPRTFLERLVGDVRILHPRLKNEVVLDVACGEIWSDRRLLGHALRNLLINALEACAEGDAVAVACRDADGRARISVRNPGVIEADIRDQLFKRYVSSKDRDRGLGCYVARLMTENCLNGAIDFVSRDGVTEFTITLPGKE